MPTYAYDQAELRKALGQLAFGAGLAMVLAYQWNINHVMMIQTIMLLRGAYSNQLVQIHLLGHPATGTLARPFKVDNPFECVAVSGSGGGGVRGGVGERERGSRAGGGGGSSMRWLLAGGAAHMRTGHGR